jgi:hypothetical protein
MTDFFKLKLLHLAFTGLAKLSIFTSKVNAESASWQMINHNVSAEQ